MKTDQPRGRRADLWVEVELAAAKINVRVVCRTSRARVIARPCATR